MTARLTPDRVRTWVFAVLVASALVVGTRAVLIDAPPIEMSLFSTFSCFGYASVGCVEWLRGGSLRRRRLAAGTTVLLAVAVVSLALWRAATPLNVAKAGLISLGLAGALQLVRHALSAPDSRSRRERAGELRDGLIAPLATAQVTYFLWPSTALNPVYDLYVHHFERTIGIVREPIVQQVYATLDPWALVATISYLALPIGLSALVLHQPTSSLRTRVLLATLLTAAAGFLLYQLCPVVGPLQSVERVFSVSLADAPALVPQPIDAPGRVPRNGMPSLHAVWALLIILNARPLPVTWRRLAALFAVLNLAASLGKYQHWFMDHLVAVPMTAAIQLAVVNQPWRSAWSRWSLAVAAMAVTMFWVLSFRYGLLTDVRPWMGWMAILATMALALIGFLPWRFLPEAPPQLPDTAAEPG